MQTLSTFFSTVRPPQPSRSNILQPFEATTRGIIVVDVVSSRSSFREHLTRY